MPHLTALSGKVYLISDLAGASCHNVTLIPRPLRIKMSDYDYGPRDIRIDTSFSRPASSTRDFLVTESLPRDRYSRTSHVSRFRDVTWISASQPSQYPANQTTQTSPWQHSTPVQRPPLALHKSQPTLSDSDEYMTVDIESGVEEEKGYGFNEGDDKKLHGKKRFYGGLMNGLKSIPRVMSRGRLNSKDQVKPGKQGTPIISYQPNPHQSQATSVVQRQSSPNDVPQVERVDTPPSLVLCPAKPNITLDTDTSFADTRRDHTLSAVNETYEPSHSHHHDELFRSPSRSHHRDTSTTSRRLPNSTEANSIPRTFHPSLPASPIFVEPPPAADFAKMESPIRPPPEEPIASQVARIRRFLRDLNGLPWNAPARISNDYFPGQGERRRYSRQRYSKTSKSWYVQRNKGTLDLLAGPSTPSTTGRVAQHVRNSHPAPIPAPFVMNPSSANLMFPGHLPGRRSRSPSSDGVPSSSSGSTGQGQAPYSGPLYPAYVAQPLFVYPSGLPPPGSSSPEQPRPVFFTSPVAPQFGSPERSRSPLRLHGASRMPVLA